MSAKAKSKLTPEQQKATMTRVLQKIKPYGFFVVCSLIVAAVSVAAQLYIPILCGSAIDMMLGKGAVDFAGVLRIIYEIIVVAVVAAFAQWLLSVCNNRITFAVSRDLRNAAMRKIQTLPLSYLDSHPSGDIVSRMVADVDTFADGLLTLSLARRADRLLAGRLWVPRLQAELTPALGRLAIRLIDR